MPPNVFPQCQNILHTVTALKNYKFERIILFYGVLVVSVACNIGVCVCVQVLKALREMEEQNARLREYIDNILAKIIEKHPDVLVIEDGP